jgi:hypothetical protein
VSLNQTALQIAVETAQGVAILRSHIPPQREAQLPQDLDCLGDRVSAGEYVAAPMRRDRFLHGLRRAFVQHPGKFRGRGCCYAASNVLLMRIGGCHFQPRYYIDPT